MSGVLRRVLGPTTAFLIGLGVAIGSGIFRTPGLVAGQLGAPLWIVGVWLFGGLFILASSLVSAELATRFPKAGGEYVYLREAYGEFMAFFFGWGYTVFIVGGGAATIAAALGEVLTKLLGLQASYAGYLGAMGIVAVTAVNARGLKAGAGLQNGMTIIKLAALLFLSVAALALGSGDTDWGAPLSLPPKRGLWAALIATLPPVLWSYEGSTDAVKMAEEIQDVQKGLPRALLGSALTLTLMYTLVNLAFLSVLGPEGMAKSKFVASDAMRVIFGPSGAKMMSVLSLVVFIGALSATTLTTVRVTFALARDGLTFGSLAKMSSRQAPVAALWFVAAVATFFTLARGFSQILNIYFLAAAVLFGLSYGSLIVFRVRERGQPTEGIFRCPAGPWLAGLLILVQVSMAALIIYEHPKDSVYTVVLLLGFAALYKVWRRFNPGEGGTGNSA